MKNYCMATTTLYKQVQLVSGIKSLDQGLFMHDGSNPRQYSGTQSSAFQCTFL